MKFTTLLTAMVMFVSVSQVRAEVVVEPLGIVVGSPKIADMDYDFRPTNLDAGTRVQLLISGFDSPVVKLDDENSELTGVTDSTGKDLLKVAKQADDGFGGSSFGSSPIGPFPQVSKDGKRMIVELVAPNAPGKGATAVQFKGTLMVVAAEGKKTVSAKDVPAKAGTVQLGDQSFEITAIGPSDWEEGKTKLEVKMSTKLLDAISSWKITAPDGTAICDGPYSTMTMMDTAQLELTLDKKVDTLNIELELFDGVKQVKVPVDVEVGLGIE